MGYLLWGFGEEIEPIITAWHYTYYLSRGITGTALGHTGDISGLMQDCRNSSMLAMELLQSYFKPLI